MIPAAAVVALLLLTLGPEREVAPPRLGVPPTNERLRAMASNGDTFIAGYTSSVDQPYSLPFVSHLDSSGRPSAGRMVPGAAGYAVAIASDGEHYLAVSGPPSAKVLLLGADGSLIREAMTLPTMVYEAPRSVIWTGSEYVVAWHEGNDIFVVRFARDGTALGTPFLAVTGATAAPFLASSDGEVRVAVTSGDEIRVFRIEASSATALENVHRGTIVDFAGNEAGFSLLIRERAPWIIVLNLYHFSRSSPPRVSATFPNDQWSQPSILTLPSGLLLFGSSGRTIVAQRLTASGETAGERLALLDARVDTPAVVAATNGAVIVFGWTEALHGINHGLDAVIAPVHESLTGRSDAIPDGQALARGASSRTTPRVARSASGTLVVWTERIDGKVWIAGSLDGRTLEITPPDGFIGEADVASDGANFLVAWAAGGIRARRIGAYGTMGNILEIADDSTGRHRVAAGHGGYLIVWEDREWFPYVARQNSVVYGRRVDGDGQVVDSDRVMLAGGSASEPAVASDGERFLVAYTTGSICLRLECVEQTPLDLKARIFSSSLLPLSGELTLSDEPRTNDFQVAVASSGDGWGVVWAVQRTLFLPDPPQPGTHEINLSDIGSAEVSADGVVVSAQRPVPAIRAPRRTNPDIVWTNGAYLTVWEGEHGQRPALAPGLLIYTRAAPELGLGLAPQVFLREFADGAARRRAVGK